MKCGALHICNTELYTWIFDEGVLIPDMKPASDDEDHICHVSTFVAQFDHNLVTRLVTKWELWLHILTYN